MTEQIRLDVQPNSIEEPMHRYYAREELMDRRVIAVDYATGTLPRWIEQQGEYLGDTPTETSAVTFWRMPTELLAVQATLSTTVVDKAQIL